MKAPLHGGHHFVRCSMDHLGEGFYELKLSRGHELLRSEPFEDLERLLRRSEELRDQTKAEIH